MVLDRFKARKQFEKLKADQRRKAVLALAMYIERLKDMDLDEMQKRLSLDGQLTSSEKTHLKIVDTLIRRRLNTLVTSRATFLSALGLSR